jgi:hemerythrin
VAIVEWTEELSVGVPALDRDHQHLIELLNQLHDVVRRNDAREVIAAVLIELIRYTGHHFAAEEDLMARAGFPGLETHRHTHDMLRQRVRDYEAEFREDPRSVIAAELFDFLCDWLIHHIKTEDMEYRSALTRH